MRTTIKWVLFTKRTNEPKLSYIELRLDAEKIKHKRNGESFHAPMLYIEEKDQDKAWAILDEKWTKRGGIGPNPRGRTALDDIPDNDTRFEVYRGNEESGDWTGFWSAHNQPGSLAEFDRYIAGDR